jgi:hypothetical protein
LINPSFENNGVHDFNAEADRTLKPDLDLAPDLSLDLVQSRARAREIDRILNRDWHREEFRDQAWLSPALSIATFIDVTSPLEGHREAHRRG